MRGGGENSVLVEVSESHRMGISLYMRCYRTVDKRTFTVLIKHQRVTCLGKAWSTQTSGGHCFGKRWLMSVVTAGNALSVLFLVTFGGWERTLLSSLHASQKYHFYRRPAKHFQPLSEVTNRFHCALLLPDLFIKMKMFIFCVASPRIPGPAVSTSNYRCCKGL